MRSSNILELLNEATNYLRNNPDERLNFTPFFDSNLCGDEPPCLIHSEWDLCDVGWRMVEAWHMFRRVTGSMPCIEETRLRKVVFESLKEDGLSYRPDYEWSKPEAWMWDQGRALLALCTLAEGGDQADWAIERIRGLLRALERIALKAC